MVSSKDIKKYWDNVESFYKCCTPSGSTCSFWL